MTDTFIEAFRRGESITAARLSELALALQKLLVGGQGIRVERFGQQIRVSGQKQRIPPDPVRPVWLPFGRRGGEFTGEIRRSKTVMELCQRINALEKARSSGTEIFVAKAGAPGKGNSEYDTVINCEHERKDPLFLFVVDSFVSIPPLFKPPKVTSVYSKQNGVIPFGYLVWKTSIGGSDIQSYDITDVVWPDQPERESWQYTTDVNNHFVQIFLALGLVSITVFPVTTLGLPGTADGEFDTPTGITSNSTKVYVMDTGNSRVQAFEALKEEIVSEPHPSGGPFLFKWGTPGAGNGEFAAGDAYGIAATDDWVFVADSGNDRVEKFNASDGTYVAQWGVTGGTDGEFRNPRQVAVDPVDEEVFVCDTGNHRIQVFDFDGVFLRKFGSFGAGDGQLDSPEGLSYGLNEIVVADTGNNRIQEFRRQGAQTVFFAYTADSVLPFGDPGSAIPLGDPDGGVRIPNVAALTRLSDVLDHRQITDMRDAIEALAPGYTNAVTGNPFDWTPFSGDNLYFGAFGADYDWTRSPNEMIGTDTYDIDINEVEQTVLVLEGSTIS